MAICEKPFKNPVKGKKLHNTYKNICTHFEIKVSGVMTIRRRKIQYTKCDAINCSNKHNIRNFFSVINKDIKIHIFF